MPQITAGVLMYRMTEGGPEVFLVHPGGPFWASKDAGAWSIPKGLPEANEDDLAAARREFAEETGSMPDGEFVRLGAFPQKSGKTIVAFAVEGDLDPDRLVSNMFEMEWPPRSGVTAAFPEVDRGGWFSASEAAAKLMPGQRPVLAALFAHLGMAGDPDRRET